MTSPDSSTRVGANGPPAAHSSITDKTARSLLKQQHPEFAGLELGTRFDGWDMVTYRLGDHFAMRLPRVEAAVASLETEIRWLPELSPDWGFPSPTVERVGKPGKGYPWPWAIVSWLPGTTADIAPLDTAAGPGLGLAFAQVHTRAAADAPFNKEQSIGMATRADDVAWALTQLAGARGPRGESVDVPAAQALWADAMAANEPTERIWGHADAHGSNILADEGAFVGIIDWGKMAVCDRAVDLGFLYTAIEAGGAELAFAAYRTATLVDDPGLEARARGIALNKCLMWATLDRPANTTMAWRGLNSLGVTA
ncbi:phosphotransferase [Demequina aurantiaca]|uniref:phosphotransferase n=1 Tax=Demequina aurantiaca TaxID=676200 RepID=UPI000782D716|nr:phosphotransferase [Demequina aurantiaca]